MLTLHFYVWYFYWNIYERSHCFHLFFLVIKWLVERDMITPDHSPSLSMHWESQQRKKMKIGTKRRALTSLFQLIPPAVSHCWWWPWPVSEHTPPSTTDSIMLLFHHRQCWRGFSESAAAMGVMEPSHPASYERNPDAYRNISLSA